MNELEKFISDQLSVWPLASGNFRALKSVRQRGLNVGGLDVRVQFNPCRIVSSTATTDPAEIAARPCFLCVKNRPAEQFHIRFSGRKGRLYNVQVNPYPIFPGHLVIASDTHIPQSIWHHFVDMVDFSEKYPEYTVYYNGPLSGASAPDHLHFQACPRHMLPLENAISEWLDSASQPLVRMQDAALYRFEAFTRGVYALQADTEKSLVKLMYRLVECAPLQPGDSEPRLNMYAFCEGGKYRAFVTLRRAVRSHHYFSTGDDHLCISPGCAEMAGVFVAPCEEDFLKVNSKLLEDMMKEVSISQEADERTALRLTRTQPKLDVGIMSAKEIEFEIISDGAGVQKACWKDGKIEYNGNLYDELLFDEVTRSTMFAEPSFVLHDVVIGVNFHWQRKVTQKFAGSLKFIVEGDVITAVNTIGVEDYLLSVISSEMKASATLEYLKAHAVISRSWVMAQLGQKGGSAAECLQQGFAADGTPMHVQWFGHSDHEHFDVCADDHCQRYQGLTMAVGENVRTAIDETWGQVLTSEGKICDCRFSKCCGGTMELFSTCWEDRDYPYLKAVPDAPKPGDDPFCHTSDKAILSQVLNDYDLETKAFFDWEVRYSREEVSELIRRRSGIDFGTIIDLEPIERGPSGRLKLLKVIGSAKTMVIGKELIIRRWLSESHLYSSAFDVSWEGDTLVLTGRGWGHGVGFCQIGAAVMAYKGYDYKQILAHYYPGSTLETK